MSAPARHWAQRANLLRPLLWLVAATACGELIGIEDAEVDPRLAPKQEGSGGSAPGASGGAMSGGSAAQQAGRSGGNSGGAGTASGGGLAAGGTDFGGQAGQAGEGGGSESTLCDSYCDQITEYCAGSLEQYRDRAQCLRICELLPEGELGGEDDNNVACRLRYASKARYSSGTELGAYCRQAGPGGDGRCGSNCEGYCTLMMNICTEHDADVYHFEQHDECLDACTALPLSDLAYSTSDPLVSDGNHVQCRLFHVTSAAMLDTEEHCEHAVGFTLCASEDEP